MRAVAGQRGDRSVDLVEQATDLRAIIGIPVGQHRRDDLPAVGIDADVQRLWGGGEVTHHRRRTQPDGDAPCHGKTT
jgi:hypothetical protein